MNTIVNFFIGVSLSMDAFSISVISGSLIAKRKILNSFKISFLFGFFQFFMPILGWLSGIRFLKYISNFDHIVAFLILFIIGIKIIYESKKIEKTINFERIFTLFFLSIATSIDAYAVGLTFSLLKVKVLTPALIIGFTTFSICLIGFYLGNKIKKFFGDKLELFSGIILILVGFKILLS
ncbi:MAG: manganese efflux pump MntP family protein [Candidatus Omnitrophica bacterium]|nr:manganese efflux pump MntP family protein [Candidatus Omnitrophota bacterium]MCM8809665.1 manganese efflux pump MntP family protein [Candidatus Omnitrophota bacterium]MCM8810097.1 manganese efflux pump MntP family protein [Candidatus Omnitrophota bacterium]MCM8832836.1 manganese efflux pump MntP family protein [Candidatus Omnitrophota bacterium]